MSSVVSVHDDQGLVAGTGVVVAADFVLTCAHVVNVALGEPPDCKKRPDGKRIVTIRFNGAPGQMREASVDLADGAWVAPPADGGKGADLCVLRLTKRRPAEVEPASIRLRSTSGGFPARAAGYPEDWNKKGSSPQLNYADCKVVGPVHYLWEIRADQGAWLATALTKSRSAGLIYRGFSGGPLEDGNGGHLIGLLTTARNPLAGTAYAIPARYFPPYILRLANVDYDEMPPGAPEAGVRKAAEARAVQASELDTGGGGSNAGPSDDRAASFGGWADELNKLVSDYSAIFVGRLEEAERLQSIVWSEDPGYIFVRGDPGAGKSALLASFVQGLRAGGGSLRAPLLIYHFIRLEQGDQVRVLGSLNSQIAATLDSSDPGARATIEDRFSTLWTKLTMLASRERPLVLVVDGLDELEEPGKLGRWLPRQLASYTHVVASARTTFDPLRHLPNIHLARSARPPILLGPLKRDDVQLLIGQHLRAPAEAVRLVEPVFCLTKGFPLTTRLLVQDIAQNGAGVLKDKARLPALMQDYLAEEARHLVDASGGLVHRRLLAILTESQGPITVQDLGKILRGLAQVEVELALQPLLRCLASPTSLEFLHLELKRAVSLRLRTEEKEAARAAISQWMLSASDVHGGAPIPAYVLDHFVDQFGGAVYFDVVMSRIVSERWCTSRYAQRGSHADYVNDLDRVREGALKIKPNWLVFCQASYIRAQLHTLAANIPTTVLLLLADLGRVDEAVGYAMLQPDLVKRARTLCRLSVRYFQRQEKGKAASALANAKATLEQNMSPRNRCFVLSVLAASFKDVNDLAAAKRMAKDCRSTLPLVDTPYDHQYNEALRAAIDASIFAEGFHEAIDLLQSQVSKFDYAEALERTVIAILEGGAFDHLLDRLSGTQRSWIFDHALGKAAAQLAANGFVAEAKQIADLAPGYAYDALISICESLARKGDIESCLTILGDIGLRSKSKLIASLTGWRRFLCNWNIATDWILRHSRPDRYERLAGVGRSAALQKILLCLTAKVAVDQAPALAQRLMTLTAIEPGISSIRVRSEVVSWLAKTGADGAAVDLARALQREAVALGSSSFGREARQIASQVLGDAKKWDEAYAILEPLLKGADASASDQSADIDWTRVLAIRALAQCGEYDEALGLCDQIRHSGVRASGLAEVAKVLAGSSIGRAREIAAIALDLAAQQSNEKDREVTYESIAFLFAEGGLADDARAAAFALPATARKKGLSTVVYLLLEAGDLDGAEATALSISNWDEKNSELLRVMRFSLRRQKYERAFVTARKHPYSGFRFDAVAEWCRIVLANRPEFERDRWIRKAMATTERDVSARGVIFRAQIGRILLDAEDRGRAETILLEALALARPNPAELATVYARLAFACVADHSEDARAIVSTRLVSDASTQDASLVLAQLGDWKGVDLATRSTRGAPRVSLLVSLGSAAFKAGLIDNARSFLNELQGCIDTLPSAELPNGLAAAARLHFLLGDEDCAAALCRKAYEGMAAFGDAAKLESLATNIALAGQKELALACLNPDNEYTRIYSRLEIANALAEAGARGAANDLLQAVMRDLKGDQSGLDGLIREMCSKALATVGQYDLARRTALDLDDPVYSVPALVHLAKAHHEAGHQEESQKVLALALPAIPTTEAGEIAQWRAEAASVLLQLGQRERAREEFRMALEQAMAAGADVFLRTLGAGALVVVEDMQTGEPMRLIESLEQAATVLRDNQKWPGAQDAA